jgi:hypothetical protein
VHTEYTDLDVYFVSADDYPDSLARMGQKEIDGVACNRQGKVLEFLTKNALPSVFIPNGYTTPVNAIPHKLGSGRDATWVFFLTWF